MVKDMSRGFLSGKQVFPRKISFHDGTVRDILFPEKLVFC